MLNKIHNSLYKTHSIYFSGKMPSVKLQPLVKKKKSPKTKTKAKTKTEMEDNT
jgi:hypothetical protein